MGLVLKEEQPVLVLAVDIDLHLDGAGVDLLGLVETGEDAVLLEPLRADRAISIRHTGLASRPSS